MQNKNLPWVFGKKGRQKNSSLISSPIKILSQLAGGLLVFWGLLVSLVFYMGVSSAVTTVMPKNGGHGHDDDTNNPAPGEGLAIPAGITGAWFNPDRDGEGFFIEVVNHEGDRVFVVTWYTYEEGQQMWLLGSAPLNPDDSSIVVPMERFHGGRPGVDPNAFDPETVERSEWGTLEFSFSSCNEGTVHFEESSLGFSGTIPLTRLTLIDKLGCGEPDASPES